MAKKLPEVDAVLVGMGWSGSIMARELSKAGLTVVALERGVNRVPGEDFTLPGIRDELRFSVRQELMQDGASAPSCRVTASAAWARTGTR
jgi:gluconate 2-dehydrogenase alpha chain